MNFDFRGKKIHYEVHGAGEPLLVLNGIFMSAASWAPFVPALSRQNSLILVDFLDQGRSEQMSLSYGQDLQSDLVLALCAHLKLSSLSLLGISYGGQVAIRVAAQEGVLIKRLILANTTALVSPWLEDLGRGWAYAIASKDATQFFRTCMPLIYSPKFYAENPAWLRSREAQFSERVLPSTYDAFLRLLASTEGLDLREKLPKISCPTLLISAEHDYLTPCADQEYIAKQIPCAKHMLIKDCGHASMYEKPAEFVSLVQGFLHADLNLRVV